MFALEIIFQDGVSQPEMVFVRRPQALIGASDYAHVVVDDLKDLGCQLRLVRDLGRAFRCKPVGSHQIPAHLRQLEERIFDGEAAIDLGAIRLHITALDSDLLLKDTEPPDRAGVRILRQACALPAPLFPAVVVRGANPMVISFVSDQPIYIGRSRQCALRLDSADISAKHARMGYEGGEFWVEDLGSTNGTFVNQQQISGRVNIPAGTPITLGREISVFGVTSQDQIARASQTPPEVIERSQNVERRYPVLLSVSEVARPAKLVLNPGTSINIGRDPSSDIWLGAPHVSRRHCAFTVDGEGDISVSDHSTNGTAYDGGILKKGEVLTIDGSPRVFDFGGGVTVALCFNEGEEQAFIASHGAPHAFGGSAAALPAETSLHNQETDRAKAAPQYAQEALPMWSSDLPVWRRLLEFYQSARGWERALVIVTILAVAAAIVVVTSFLFGVFRSI